MPIVVIEVIVDDVMMAVMDIQPKPNQKTAPMTANNTINTFDQREIKATVPLNIESLISTTP